MNAGTPPVGSEAGEGLQGRSGRLNFDVNGAKNGLGQLVLTLMKLLQELLERQAIRRVDAGSLTDKQTERLGLALMQQAQEIERLRKEFGLGEEDLNLDLGPLGRLLYGNIMLQQQALSHSVESSTLADVLERVLDKGIVIAGDIRIKLVDIELLSIQIRLVICSVDKAKEMGMDWWVNNPIFRQDTHPEIAPASLTSLEERLATLEDTLRNAAAHSS